MKSLIHKTIDKAVRWNKQWPNSVIFWSGGKDSTVLLHFLKFKCGIDLPVVQFRQPKFRERYAYSDKLIKDWQLTMYEYPAFKHTLADGPDVETGEVRFDLLHYFQWGKNSVVLSLGTERPKANEPFMCGVDDFLMRPTGTFNFPWNGVWIGTKWSDTDLIKGHVPLAQDIRHVDGNPASLYLLKDWNDENVYEYLETNNVQPDPTRYAKGKHGWMNNPDKSLNADFYPV